MPCLEGVGNRADGLVEHTGHGDFLAVRRFYAGIVVALTSFQLRAVVNVKRGVGPVINESTTD